MSVLPTWSQNAWNKQWVKRTSVGPRRTCPVPCHWVAANLLPWKPRLCSQEYLEALGEPMTFFCAWSPCSRALLDAPKSIGFSTASYNYSCNAIAPGSIDTLQRRSDLQCQGSEILALSYMVDQVRVQTCSQAVKICQQLSAIGHNSVCDTGHWHSYIRHIPKTSPFCIYL